MGYYINPQNANALGKLTLIEQLAKSVTMEVFRAHSAGKNDTFGVCVVDNGYFNAAGIAYSDEEASVFAGPDSRPRKFFLMKWEDIRKLDPKTAGAIDIFRQKPQQ